MKKYAIVLISVLALCSCSGRIEDLKRAEQTLGVDAVECERILDDIDASALRGKSAALYGLLKTRADYITGKEIASDSLARLATDYWGIRRSGHYQSLSWLALGCAYSAMERDAEAIYALVKSKGLFKDTLSPDYADLNSMLGRHFLRRGLYDEALGAFTESSRLYHNLGDCRQEAFSEFNLGKVYYEKKDYSKARGYIERMMNDKCLDEISRNSCIFLWLIS